MNICTHTVDATEVGTLAAELMLVEGLCSDVALERAHALLPALRDYASAWDQLVCAEVQRRQQRQQAAYTTLLVTLREVQGLAQTALRSLEEPTV
jgi:hypothetical protein